MDEIKNFDDLPDDAVVPRCVTAAVLHISERTVRRSWSRRKAIRAPSRQSGRRHPRHCARDDRPDVAGSKLAIK